MPKSCLTCGCSCDAERVWQSICSTLEQHRAWRGPTGSGQHFCHQLTSGTAWLTDWVIEKTDTQPHRPSSPTPCVYTQPPGCAAAPLCCGYAAMVSCLKSQLLRKSSQFIPWSRRLSRTHVDAGGVKRTLVGDAGIANGIWEAAVCQEAPPAVNDGPHHRHSESDGWSGCHQSCSQTDWEKWPCLRKEQKDKKSHQDSETWWLIRWSFHASSWETGASAKTINISINRANTADLMQHMKTLTQKKWLW